MATAMEATDIERQQLSAWASEELAREDLIEFSCRIDPQVAEQYRAAHLGRIAERLEAAARGEIKRLFITCPPRHWKSSLVSEKFPTWFLARNPKAAVILASYGLSLSEKFSRSIRDTILYNHRFKELFPNCRMKEGVGGVHDWSLDGAIRSSCRCVGTGGGITGHGAQLIVIDDPVADALEAGSITQRNRVWEWYQQTLRTRLEPGGVIVLIMSRWHEDDLAGRILKAADDGEGEPFERLEITVQSDLEPVWPERWPKSELSKLRSAIGSRAFAALYSGSPRAMEGAILDSSKLVMINESELPKLFQVVRRWDLAFSDRDGADYVAGTKMGIDSAGNKYILHIKRIHGRWTQSKPVIMSTALTDGINVTQAIECNGTQLGYFQDIKDSPQMNGITVAEDKPEGTKEMRASSWGSRLIDGTIFCVRGEWNQSFFDEMDFFPNGQHDDQIDATSGAYLMLCNSGAIKDVSRIRYGRPVLTPPRFRPASLSHR